MTNSGNPLQSSVQFIPGVGPKRAEVLKKAGISTVSDLLFYLPRRYLDRSTVKKIADLNLDSGEARSGKRSHRRAEASSGQSASGSIKEAAGRAGA